MKNILLQLCIIFLPLFLLGEINFIKEKYLPDNLRSSINKNDYNFIYKKDSIGLAKDRRDSLKKNKPLIKKHNIGFGARYASVVFDNHVSYDYLWESQISTYYQYNIPINFNISYDALHLLFLQFNYNNKFFNSKAFKSRFNQLTILELGYKIRFLEYGTNINEFLPEYLFSIGFANYTYKGLGPIYLYEEDKLIQLNNDYVQFLTFRLGAMAALSSNWVLGSDCLFMFNYNKNSYPKVASGLNVYLLRQFNFKK